MALLKLNYDSLSYVSVGKVRFVHFMKACSYNVNFEMQIRFQTSCFPARKQELWWIHRRIDTGEAGPKHGVRGTPGGGDSHMKQTGMLVVSLRGVNFGFWSRLGCSGQSTNILSRHGLV